LQSEVEPGRCRIAKYRMDEVDLIPLCEIMERLKTSVSKLADEPPAVENSYFSSSSSSLSKEEVSEMSELWCCVEDLPEVINDDIDEAIEKLNLRQPDIEPNEEDDNEPDCDDDTASMGSDSASIDADVNNLLNILSRFRQYKKFSSDVRFKAFGLSTDILREKLRQKEILTKQTKLVKYFDNIKK
jgi:hypothetical protein